MKFSNLKLTHSPLINRLHLYEWENDPRLQNILDLENGNDLTDSFLDDLEWRAKNQHNIVIEIKGIRGSGKSFLARGIKTYQDKIRGMKSSINDIVFTRSEFLESYKKAKRGQTIIIDEDFSFQTQTGSLRLKESLNLAEQTFRIEEVSTIACSVAPVSSHLYDFYLVCYDYDIDNGYNRAILFNTSQINSVIYRPAGYILFPTRKYLDKKLEEAYIKKKKKFTKIVKENRLRTLQDDYDEYAKKIIEKYGLNIRKPPVSYLKILLRREFPHFANTELNDILDTLKVFLYEIHGNK
ncbi:MAG: hypothetical protein ABIM64_01720 [candidate division WOR-3 bacterium]